MIPQKIQPGSENLQTESTMKALSTSGNFQTGFGVSHGSNGLYLLKLTIFIPLKIGTACPFDVYLDMVGSFFPLQFPILFSLNLYLTIFTLFLSPWQVSDKV
jgi:hypothetical protein